MFFDTHAHYDDERFDEDRDSLIPALKEGGTGLVLNPGCDAASSRKALELAGKYDFFYAAAGIHPENLPEDEETEFEAIASLAADPRCKAIGEIGLDYYWDSTQAETQKKLFIRQLQLAYDMNLPVIVHDREAHGDSMEIIRRFKGIRGVFHCYSGSAEMAEELLKLGWYLGFDGPVTYKNARKALEVLAVCPDDRMLLETDSPYLSPVPLRGKRNDSRNLRFVAEKIAEVKGTSSEAVELLSFENGKRLFNIE